MPRIFELIISFFAAIILLPFFFVIIVLIKIDSRGSWLYRSKRVGKDGRLFTMYKFRTMSEDANKIGPPITGRDDSRITRIGAVLRKTKLDELPQLINVLKGEMGFVGARPEDPGIVEQCPALFETILKYRPGMTSPASIRYRAEETLIPPDHWETFYCRELLPEKIKIDAEYMQQTDFMKDIGVIVNTFGIGKKYRSQAGKKHV